MKKILTIVMAITLTIGLLVPTTTALAAAYQSGSNVTTLGANTLSWTGQGAIAGVLENIQCDENLPEGYKPGDAYLLWVFTTDGGSATATPGTTPQLILGGTGSGTYNYLSANPGGSEFKFVTPYFTPDNNLTATVSFNTTFTGNGSYELVISHGCSGDGGSSGGGDGELEVGGTVYPVNKAALLAPWIALAAVALAGTFMIMRRSRVHN